MFKLSSPSLLLSCAFRHRSPLISSVQAKLSSTASGYFDEIDKESPAPLLRLENARLGYQNSHATTPPLDITIQHPSQGGHVLLGRNATNKTLLSNALASHENYLHDGKVHTEFRKSGVATVSFESHEQLLQQGGSVYHAISHNSNKLSKAAQFLIVRFGLYHLLNRDVTTLSTGEIRKVLIIRALSRRPKLLILDNAFDGLDVQSRENLADLVSRTLRGFRPDILVQGVSARDTAHTQVLLLTHRPEEIVDEIETVTIIERDNGDGESIRLVTSSRDGRTGEELLASALGVHHEEESGNNHWHLDHAWEDPSLPTVNDVEAWWNMGREDAAVDSSNDEIAQQPLVQATSLSIKRGDSKLLWNLDWIVKRGDRWLVAGGNGQGKSTLSRMVAKNDEGGIAEGELIVSTGGGDDNTRNTSSQLRPNIGWVSTELHMALARSDQTARQVLLVESATTSPSEVAEMVCEWMQINDSLLPRPFSQLAQGEQKLILIAASLISRPQLLVLDEPCQGLDWVHRKKLLGLIERICQATPMSLIYITHHLEEMIPSVGSVLHLVEGRAVYNGSRDSYDPRIVVSDTEKN